MKLDTLCKAPAPSLIYLERYVNRGSPSGFLAENSTSPVTSPACTLPFFDLPILCARTDVCTCYQPARIPAAMRSATPSELLYPCHPDIVTSLLQSVAGVRLSTSTIRVSPTSSARTVYALQHDFYIKLHYPPDIGRFSRANPHPKWLASLENSEELASAIRGGLAPIDFAMLREVSGVLVGRGPKPTDGAGVLYREARPFPSTPDRVVIPFFSLFSADRFAPEDPNLLVQILGQSESPLERTMALVIEPVLRCFRFQAMELGFLPENNAQNLLLELTPDLEATRIVHRDMMGTFKDVAIRRQRGRTELNSYHSVDADADPEECHRRRSFAYDFKLGEYVFAEIEQLLLEQFAVPAMDFREAVRMRFRELVTGDVNEYFGSTSTWWAYKPIHPAGRRPYQKMNNPKYR